MGTNLRSLTAQLPPSHSFEPPGKVQAMLVDRDVTKKGTEVPDIE